MANEREDLRHLQRYRTNPESYKTLLTTAKSVLTARQRTPTFIAEDLWARHEFFGAVRPAHMRKHVDEHASWNDLETLFRMPWSVDSQEQQTIQLIYQFLLYATAQKDLQRASLIGSSRAGKGFAFVEQAHQPLVEEPIFPDDDPEEDTEDI